MLQYDCWLFIIFGNILQKEIRTAYMWEVQVQKDLVDLSKHCIHEINALASLDRALEKNTQKQLHSSSKIVSLRSQRLCRVIYARIADLFVSRAAELIHALRTCLFTDTHS